MRWRVKIIIWKTQGVVQYHRLFSALNLIFGQKVLCILLVLVLSHVLSSFDYRHWFSPLRYVFVQSAKANFVRDRCFAVLNHLATYNRYLLLSHDYLLYVPILYFPGSILFILLDFLFIFLVQI